MILEYCPYGDLLTFMRERREMFDDRWSKTEETMDEELTYVDLSVICCQIAKGMEFLQSKHVRAAFFR